MWEFVKSNPWMFVVGGAILVTAIIGVIIGIKYKGFWADKGLLERDGHKLKWKPASLPIGVIFHPKLLLAWQATFRGASRRFELSIGRPPFDDGVLAPKNYNIMGPPPAGFIFVQVAHEGLDSEVLETTDKGGAVTQHKYERPTGEIKSATVTLPDDSGSKRMEMMVHELGHVLGLDHDERRESIMYPTLNEQLDSGQLSEADAKLLKGLYG